jgi:hypothetical protein
LVVTASTAAFAESYAGRYVVNLFGDDGPGRRAVDSHTFAAFFDGDAIERGARGAPPTMSWLPEDGNVRRVGLHRGRSFALDPKLWIAEVRGYTPFGRSVPSRFRGWCMKRYYGKFVTWNRASRSIGGSPVPWGGEGATASTRSPES